MKITAIILNILLGLLFIFSGFTKILVIEPFEYKLVEAGFPWQASLLAARLIIGLEWALGLLLLTQNIFRKKTYFATLGLLLLFTLQLLYAWLIKGDTSNCECFGELLPFSPLQGILKNLVLMLLTALAAWFWKPFRFRFRKAGLILLVLALLSAFTLPFVLNPMNYETSSHFYEKGERYALGTDTLYHSESIAPPEVDLRRGKHIVAFMSLTCPHCRVAAKKIRLMKEQNPQLPFFVILNGRPALQETFFNDTRMTNVPYVLYNERASFARMAGPSLPAIYWLQNDTVVNESTHLDLNREQIEAWLQENAH